MVGRLSALIVVVLGGVMCCTKRADIYHTTFTKVDSVTDSYLSLQDSVLRSWNIMIHDDNQKIKALRNLLHELQVTSSKDSLVVYEEKLDHLKALRYDQESMVDPAVIEKYDLSSQQLTSDLISIAEDRSEFGYNTTLQKLVKEVRIADQRMTLFRLEYDAITKSSTRFCKQTKSISLKSVKKIRWNYSRCFGQLQAIKARIETLPNFLYLREVVYSFEHVAGQWC